MFLFSCTILKWGKVWHDVTCVKDKLQAWKKIATKIVKQSTSDPRQIKKSTTKTGLFVGYIRSNLYLFLGFTFL